MKKKIMKNSISHLQNEVDILKKLNTAYLVIINVLVMIIYFIYNYYPDVVKIVSYIETIYEKILGIWTSMNLYLSNHLTEVNKIFNNREIALGIWIVIFALIFLRDESIRKSLLGVFKTAIAKKLLVIYFAMGVYIFIEVRILMQIGLWEIAFLKDTIYWILFTAFSLVAGGIMAKDFEYFKSKAFESLKFVIVIEFITNYYSYSVLAEFFILPVIIMATLMHAHVVVYSERYGENGAKMTKIFSTMLSVIGFIFLSHSLYEMIENYELFFTVTTLRQVLVTPLLTLMYLPVPYFTALISTYEQLFIRLGFKEIISDQMKKYFKLKAIAHCGINLRRLAIFSKNYAHLIWYAESKKELDKNFKNMRSMYLASQNEM